MVASKVKHKQPLSKKGLVPSKRILFQRTGDNRCVQADVRRDEFQLSAIKRCLSRLQPDKNCLFQRALSSEMANSAKC